MKKTLRTVIATSLLAFSLGLTGCQKVTQKLADQINSKAATSDTKDDFTYDKLVKKLGSGTGGVAEGLGGIAVWTETKGNTTYTLTVTFNGDKRATKAVYAEATKEEEKKS